MREPGTSLSMAAPEGADVVDMSVTHALSLNKSLVAFHAKALIAAFEDVEDYDPLRNHNSKRPVLWSDDPDFQEDVKAILAELRRLNEYLEAGKELDSTMKQKIVAALTSGAGKIFNAACATIGAGLGYTILGACAQIVSDLGFAKEMAQITNWHFNAK